MIRFSGDRDAGPLALADLHRHDGAGLELEPLLGDLLAFDPHAALIDVAIGVGRGGDETGGLEHLADADLAGGSLDRHFGNVARHGAGAEAGVEFIFGGIGGASACGILVKGSTYLEELADTRVVVFDKTGTLTQGTFKVVKVCPVEGGTEDSLVEAAALAESWSKHPISLSIKAAYGKDIDSARVTDVEELGGHGVTARVDGKPVAAGNARLMAKLGLTVPDVPQTGTIVHVAIDGKYAGYLLISDVVKPHSAQAIKGLKQAGVRKTVMLTGDAEPVAKAVSAELGIDEYHAGLLPGDKVERIENLLAAKNPKEMLAFVGDGINDAPVLSRVDVGIAMGALGSDAAIEAADVVLMDDDPAKIALAMRIARRTKSIVYQNIVFALAIKAACLLLGALGIANMWAAIFADVGVMVLAVLNATRALYTKDLTKK